MKRSEILHQEALEEENDSKAFSLHYKAMREVRLERFEEHNYTEQLEKKNCIVVPFNGTKITIDTQTDKWGVIDYFPKANKVLVRKDNEWKTTGLKWINENILN